MLSNMKYIAVIIVISFSIVIDGQDCDNCGDTKQDKLVLTNMDGYDENDGHYYKVFRDATNWGTAREICENEHSYLVIINSIEEATFVRQLIRNARSPEINYPGAWAGIHDSNGNADWRTIKDSSLKDAGYDVWWIPDKRQNRNQCGTVKTCGRYDAMPCDRNLMFVCEMEISGVEVN